MPPASKAAPVVRQLDAVVEQHRAATGRGVEAAHSRLHAANLSGEPRDAAAEGACGPWPDARAQRGARSAAVSTSRRSEPRVAAVSSRRPVAACRRAEPGPNSGRSVAACHAASSSVVPRPSASRTKPRRVRGRPPQRRGQLRGAQGRQVGREGADSAGPGGPRARRVAPWTSAGFRPASGSSRHTSAPTPASARAAAGSSVTTTTLATSGAGQRRDRRVQREGQREVRPVRARTAGRAGSWRGQPLDRHHEAPPPVVGGHAHDPASPARHRVRRPGD